MRNFKKSIAVLAAACMSMTAFSAMTFSVNAAEVAYTGPSEGALATNDDGTTLRLNLYNIWGNSIEDIDPATAIESSISVNFTISGLGDATCNINEDGTEGDAFYAALCGSIGTNGCWTADDAAFAPVAIEGDGTYTVTWELAEPSGTIDCLMISTNINIYNFSETGDTSVFDVTVNSITTDGTVIDDGNDDDDVVVDPVEYIGQATMIGQFGTEQSWGGDQQNPNVSVVDITGDGQYELTWTLAEGTDVGTEGFFLAAQISPGNVDNFTTDTLENLALTLDEVWIDGVMLEGYDASNAVNTAYYEGSVGTSRIYLRGDWAQNDTKIIADSTVIESSIKMVFTVSGISEAPAGLTGDANVDGKVDATDAAAVLIAAAATGSGGETTLTPEGVVLADANADGEVNAADAANILSYAAAVGSGFEGTMEDFLASAE